MTQRSKPGSLRQRLSRSYERGPVWLQNLALSVYGRRIRRQRYGGEFRSLLGSALEATHAPADRLREIRETQWRQRIQPALAQLPAYDRRAIPLDELEHVPVLTKHRLRDNLNEYTVSERAGLNIVETHTSGTTGTGLRFLTTKYAIRRQWAFWWRYRRWHDLPLGEWCGTFGARVIVPAHVNEPPFWRVNRAGPSVMFSQYHMTPERAVLYLREIQRRRLRWLHGFPSALALLARGGLEAGMAGCVDVRWVTIGGESLLPGQSRVIEKMFGVTPLQHYGLAEGVANISECPHRRLHVDEDFSVVEFLPRDDGGEGHRIVGTTLDNEVMPLLRYDTGDIATLPDDPQARCPCGRPGRLVTDIDGRKDDYLILSDESLVGRIGSLFWDAVNVDEAQVVQQQTGQALFRIVRGARYTKRDEEQILRKVRERFGDRLAVSFDYVPELSRSPGGKLRLVINELQAGKTQEQAPG